VFLSPFAAAWVHPTHRGATPPGAVWRAIHPRGRHSLHQVLPHITFNALAFYSQGIGWRPQGPYILAASSKTSATPRTPRGREGGRSEPPPLSITQLLARGLFIARCAPRARQYTTGQCEHPLSFLAEAAFHGQLQTTNPDAHPHRFGPPQIRTIAEKYGGALDLHYTGSIFTGRALLNLPRKP